MEITSKQVLLRCLEPNEGKWLTQSKDVEVSARSFYKKVYLAPSQSEDDYKEVDDAYKAQVEDEQKKLYEQQLNGQEGGAQ